MRLPNDELIVHCPSLDSCRQRHSVPMKPLLSYLSTKVVDYDTIDFEHEKEPIDHRRVSVSRRRHMAIVAYILPC